MKQNLNKCHICCVDLIEEESFEHICKKVTDYCIIDGQIWLGDSVKHYPLQKKSRNQPIGNST